MKTNDHFYASAVDPNVASHSNSKDVSVSMDELRDFSGILLLRPFSSKWPKLIEFIQLNECGSIKR